MSLLKANAVQLGQSLTASQNFTWYQPASPDGTVRLGNGNSGSVTDLVTLTSAGNLGIGTSSPGYKLDVNGNSRVAYAASGNVYTTVASGSSSIQLYTDGSTNGVYASGAAIPLTFSTNGSERMRLDSSGNLGLGVTPSASTIPTLEIGSGGFTFNQNGQVVGGSINANAYFSSGSIKYKTTGYTATYYSQGNGGHGWGIAPSGTAGNAISFTQAMTLDASGNLLVGTTSTGTGKVVLFYPSTNANPLSPANAGLNIWGDSSVRLLFGTNPSSPYGAYIQSSNTGTGFPIALNPSGGYVLINTSTGAYPLTLNGQPGANGYTLWTNYSDARLKENIVDFYRGSVLEKILLLRPVTFNYNQKTGFDEETRKRRISGFIAQEMQEVFPEMVGNIEISGESYFDTNLSNLQLYLLKAIQELSAELNELKQKVNA